MNRGSRKSRRSLKGLKPMLAGKDLEESKLQFPLYASPKIDGIRCLLLEGKALSRSFKPIPNLWVQECLKGLPDGLDGELVVGPAVGQEVLYRTSSGVRTIHGKPDFTYWIFDNFLQPGGFQDRLESIQRFAMGSHDWVRVVPQNLIQSSEDLLAYESTMLELGYEGAILRSIFGPYKWGRSTFREGYMLKLKRWKESEAIILGVEELQHNENEARRNELGYLERSSFQEGKVGGGVLGSLLVCNAQTGQRFSIGTGYTQEEREKLWRCRDSLPGKLVRYKHFPQGEKDAPRFPVFRGLRDSFDL